MESQTRGVADIWGGAIKLALGLEMVVLSGNRSGPNPSWTHETKLSLYAQRSIHEFDMNEAAEHVSSLAKKQKSDTIYVYSKLDRDIVKINAKAIQSITAVFKELQKQIGDTETKMKMTEFHGTAHPRRWIKNIIDEHNLDIQHGVTSPAVKHALHHWQELCPIILGALNEMCEEDAI